MSGGRDPEGHGLPRARIDDETLWRTVLAVVASGALCALVLAGLLLAKAGGHL